MNSSDFSIDILRGLSVDELSGFADSVKAFMLNQTQQKKGHLESSLGATELAVALHYVFNTPEDILIWDVGHQAYAHKIITDRAATFHTNRLKDGISGFPKRGESPFDPFSTGHSSTSISAIMGFALDAPKGRKHISVIGDGALTGGMAFEAINHLGEKGSDVLLVLNDNEISIDKNVGGLAQGRNYEAFFQSLGWEYYGPVSGMEDMVAAFRSAGSKTRPRVVHVKTQKATLPGSSSSAEAKHKYQDVFAHTLAEIMREDAKAYGITPAMLSGSSLYQLQGEFENRIIDTGITEQHALTLAAGLAADGKRPFVHIYSTFLQRGMDQLIHDIAMQNLPVTLVIDRAGVVGEDGSTHQGAFDLALCKSIPNLDVIAPRNSHELSRAMRWASKQNHPIAIRFPRGRCDAAEDFYTPSPDYRGRGTVLKKGEGVAVIGVGPVLERAFQALENHPVRIVDLRFASPLDEAAIHDTLVHCQRVLVLEEGSRKGGVGESIEALASRLRYTGYIECRGLPNRFVDHATPQEIWNENGLSGPQVVQWVEKSLAQDKG